MILYATWMLTYYRLIRMNERQAVTGSSGSGIYGVVVFCAAVKWDFAVHSYFSIKQSRGATRTTKERVSENSDQR